MALRMPPAFSPTIITWEDAADEGNDQHDSPSGALAAYKPTIRRSLGYWIGFAIRDGRECAILATDDDRTEDSPQALGGTFKVPRGMVISIEPLPLTRPPKKKR